MTVDFLCYHALARPSARALVLGERTVSYSAFAVDLWKVTRALQGFGLARGSLIVIGCDDFYRHWLLVLACERLCLASASVQPNEGSSGREMLGTADLVLADPHYPAGGWKTHRLDEAWWQSVLAGPDQGIVPTLPKLPEDVLRIVRTSGTTGEPKRFRLTRRMSEARQSRRTWLYRDWPTGSATLSPFNWSVGDTHGATTTALRNGIAVIAEPRVAVADMPRLIRTHGLAGLTLLPIQLKELLALLPADWIKPSWLEIRAFGAPIPEPLRQAALDRLATQVTELYGSNEVGIVAITRESGADGYGVISPDAIAEVVDDQDRPVPDGTPGLIRVRTASAFEGYLNDPGMNRRMLRDGWFYPGDTGLLDGRRLKVLGRADDQINIGGLKYPLTQLEERAQRAGGTGLKDIGIVAIAGASGIKELHVALATDGSDDRAVLDRVIAQLRPVVSGDLHFIRLAQIPRNEVGKIDRIKLEQAVVALRGA